MTTAEFYRRDAELKERKRIDELRARLVMATGLTPEQIVEVLQPYLPAPKPVEVPSIIE